MTTERIHRLLIEPWLTSLPSNALPFELTRQLFIWHERLLVAYRSQQKLAVIGVILV
jgi:hypothetical protein